MRDRTLSTLNSYGPNYRETFASVAIKSDGRVVATIEPAKRFYPVRQMQTSQAGIATLALGQVYVSLADEEPGGAIAARLYWKPLVTLIWIGALIMGFGGLVSLSDRKMRFGVARRAAKPKLSAASQPQPAE